MSGDIVAKWPYGYRNNGSEMRREERRIVVAMLYTQSILLMLNEGKIHPPDTHTRTHILFSSDRHCLISNK